MMILLSMALSPFETRCKTKQQFFSDEQCSIRWVEVKAYYVAIQGKGFLDDLKVVLVPDFNPFSLLIIVSFSVFKDWTYIFFMIETKKLFDSVPSCHIYSLQKCDLKARTFTLFLNTCVIRVFFPEKACNEQNKHGSGWKAKQGNDGKIRLTYWTKQGVAFAKKPVDDVLKNVGEPSMQAWRYTVIGNVSRTDPISFMSLHHCIHTSYLLLFVSEILWNFSTSLYQFWALLFRCP